MKYIVTSDIHLGHCRTPTSHIISSFKNSILTSKNIDIQALFISGDLFDRLLDLNAKEIKPIIDFFNFMLSYCYANSIKLRVLEGTPSHDWQQSQLLVDLNNIRLNKCDLIYHKVLDIEYIETLNKHVLYIPDEWTHDHIDLESQIRQKLLQNNIVNVDIAIMHGQFKYQLIGKKNAGFYFKEEYFLDLVKEYIHIGHYHTFSQFDRIIANGSLERLGHGEESPKGYLIVDNNEFEFIENTTAYSYITISITKNTTIEKLDRVIAKYPVNSHIRLLMNRDHEFNATFKDLKLRYLDYNLKKHNKENISESNSVTYILTDNLIDVSNSYILDSNIHDLLLRNIGIKYKLSDSEFTKLSSYISIFKDNGVINEQLTT